jgi:peptide/nickel transport system substrate-binding protein
MRDLAEAFRRGQLSRRQFIEAAAALGATAAGLSSATTAAAHGGNEHALAHGGAAHTSSATAQEQPSTPNTAEVSREETLIMGVLAGIGPTPDLQNPFNYSTNVGAGLQQLQIEPLFYQNLESGEMVPWLAEKGTMNSDFTEMTLVLREGIEWSDGQPLTSNDVLFTLDLLKKNAPALWFSEGVQRYVKNVTAVDDRTVRIALTEPNPRFIFGLTVEVYNALPIVPEHIWKDQDPTTFKNFDLSKGWPIFTGPYKLVEANQNQLVYDRRDDWWAAKTGFQPLPAPRRVVMVNPGPEDRAAASLEANEVDAIPQMGIGTFEVLRTQNSSIISWTEDRPYGWFDTCPDMFQINNMSSPWDNAEMRRGLKLAIDTKGYADLVSEGAGVPAKWLFPPYPELESLLDANKDLFDEYGYGTHDSDQALQIFEGQGYKRNGDDNLTGPDGKPVEVNLLMLTPESGGVQWGLATTAFTEYLNDVGITVKPTVVEDAVFGPAGRRGEFDVRLMWSCGSTVDPMDTMDNWHSRHIKPIGEEVAGDGSNPARWKNEQYDKIVDQIADLAPNDPKIADLFRQGLDIWLSETPSVPLNQKPWIIPFNTTYWSNWPTKENNYLHPPIWWQTTLQIILNLKPAGSS